MDRDAAVSMQLVLRNIFTVRVVRARVSLFGAMRNSRTRLFRWLTRFVFVFAQNAPFELAGRVVDGSAKYATAVDCHLKSTDDFFLTENYAVVRHFV